MNKVYLNDQPAPERTDAHNSATLVALAGIMVLLLCLVSMLVNRVHDARQRVGMENVKK